MKQLIQSLKGTRDFYPLEMGVRNWLYENARLVSESFGYQEWEGPFVESIELYAAKSGEELVKEQSFVFPDRGGDLITLRPELTPTLARMIAQRQRQLVYPLRWWSWGPCWRYERPQKGRAREFFQWNVDLVGVDSPEADAELVGIAASFLKAVGLAPDQVMILVNNRRLMEQELQALEIRPEKRSEVFRIIDKRDKLPASQWIELALFSGLTQDQVDGLIALLADQELWRKSERLVKFFAALQAMGLSEYVRFAPHIIRGLDYYTGIVFESWDRDGEFRAVLGGGRYDNLISDVGGEPLPAAGFAMGDLVATLLLHKFGCIPSDLGQSPADVLVTVFDESTLADSLALASQLRQGGLKVAVYPEATKLSRQFKYGDRMGIRLAAIQGPDERLAGQVGVKNLATGEQVNLPLDQVASAIRQMLAPNPPS
jgi:histidyl-tRNA synthetase